MPDNTPANGDTGKPWYEGKVTDPTEIGHIQNRGWDKLPAVDVALAAVKAHREAEKHLGVPADQLLRAPKDSNDTAALDNIYTRLGAPKDAAGYDEALKAVKFEDGSALDDNLLGTIRSIAHANRLNPTQAQNLAKEIVKLADGEEKTDSAAAASKLQIEQAALKTNWGTNFELNNAIARSAAQKLGISADALQAVEKAAGYKAVMEMFLTLGQKMGEDQFIRDPNAPGGGTILSREQAMAKVETLKSDKTWVAKYLAGDAAAAKELTDLNTIIASGGVVYR